MLHVKIARRSYTAICLIMPFMLLIIISAVLAGSSAFAQEAPLLFSRSGGVIYLIPKKGLPPLEIARGLQPDMGPDGYSMVYLTEGEATGGSEASMIWIKNTRTGSVRSVLKAVGRVMDPSWSPDGSHIAFLMFDENYSWSLHVVRPDGSGFRRIAGHAPGGNGPFLSGPAVWWPDGKSLLTHDIQFLYRYDLEGREIERTPLERFTGKKDSSTSTDRFIPHPVRADLMAFTMSVPGTPLFEKAFNEPNQALFVIDLKTDVKKRLTPEDMLATDIHWSKSGDLIFFSGYRDADINEEYPFKIYTVDIGTGEIEEICPGEQPSQ